MRGCDGWGHRAGRETENGLEGGDRCGEGRVQGIQYNSVMLGLSIMAFANFLANRLLWGSLLFVLALNFKQMALYYAPAVFAYLLGLCISFPSSSSLVGSILSVNIDFLLLFLLGITVISTFTIMIFPFAIFHGTEYTSLQQLAQIVHRVFPFARGLWEDKVANFWCATNIVFKYRERFSTPTLQTISLVLTLLSIIPFCLLLFLRPQKRLLPWGVAGCAWGFFLFSFQVHEKSVLLPSVVTTLVLAGGMDRDLLSWIGWLNNVVMFSMWPLLYREGLALQYTVLITFWSWLLSLHELPASIYAKSLHISFYLAAIGLHIAEQAIPQDSPLLQKLPDIWVVANAVLCFGAFAVVYLWVFYRMVDESGLLEDVEDEKVERLKAE